MTTVRRRATRAVHLKFGGTLRAQRVGGRPRAGALRAHLLCHRGGAAVRDVFSLLEEVPAPSLISPLVTGTAPVDPSTYVTFFRPWTQALECTRQGHGLLREGSRERHVVGPRRPGCRSHRGAIAARGGPLRGYSGPLRGYSGPLRGLTSRAATRHRYQVPVQSFFFCVWRKWLI